MYTPKGSGSGGASGFEGSWKQCAALSTHSRSIRVPPQLCPPNAEIETMAGQAPSGAGVPSTIAAAGGATDTASAVHSTTTMPLILLMSAPSAPPIDSDSDALSLRLGRVHRDHRELGAGGVDHN